MIKERKVSKMSERKLIVIKTGGLLPEMGNIFGPIHVPTRVPLNTIKQLVDNRRIVYECYPNDPDNVEKRILLTPENALTRNFGKDVKKQEPDKTPEAPKPEQKPVDTKPEKAPVETKVDVPPVSDPTPDEVDTEPVANTAPITEDKVDEKSENESSEAGVNTEKATVETKVEKKEINRNNNNNGKNRNKNHK